MSFDKTQQAYMDLRSIIAERSDSIVAWTGAGLSMPSNLPDWAQLKSQLLIELEGLAVREAEPTRKADIESCCVNAKKEINYWSCFSLLKQKLGAETYKACIRRVFSVAEHRAVPESYRHLWRLGLSGMITLNIDQFATRAFAEVNETGLLNNFTGKQISDYVHLLRSNSPWLANMHGILPDAGSWVFTQQDLNALMSNAGYDQFIKACFASRTVMFLGMSADDVAAGEHLARLTREGVDCGGHFWITANTGKREWAEKSGIRLITYRAKGANNEDHSELLEMFVDLMKFKSPEVDPDPVVSKRSISEPVSLPPPEDLESRPAHEIREVLNDYASRLLAVTNEDTVAKYELFSSKYSEAIYRAWFVDTNPPKNRLLGLEITDECKDGAFGTVYRAHDNEGKQYAVKVLHEKIRRNREMLQSFRRGVASMRILTSHAVPGVVRYHDASEIPAVVIMDFIEGLDLAEATRKLVLREWKDLVRVALQLTEVIRKSHRLPQRVLHRDVRPSNIMLENCWGPNADWDSINLWVLDFDLSHHLDSFDVSVSQPGQANGYLAPEQVERAKGISTRNAAVDSYGLGMTFYFLRTGTEPRFAQHRYADWSEMLDGIAFNNPCREWTSLPKRFSRLIYNTTTEEQSDRLDVSAIENELTRLNQALRSPAAVVSSEMIAEELTHRAFGHDYIWNGETLAAEYNIGNMRLRIVGNESDRTIRLDFNWVVSDRYHHQDVRKWLPVAKDKICSSLRKGGWDAYATINTGTLNGHATVGVGAVRSRFKEIVDSLVTAKEALNFS